MDINFCVRTFTGSILLIFRGESLTVQKGKLSASAWMDRKTVMANCQRNLAGYVLKRQRTVTRWIMDLTAVALPDILKGHWG